LSRIKEKILEISMRKSRDSNLDKSLEKSLKKRLDNNLDKSRKRKTRKPLNCQNSKLNDLN
jgi:hypothetical protein